jgi:hypothetical protein
MRVKPDIMSASSENECSSTDEQRYDYNETCSSNCQKTSSEEAAAASVAG